MFGIDGETPFDRRPGGVAIARLQLRLAETGQQTDIVRRRVERTLQPSGGCLGIVEPQR